MLIKYSGSRWAKEILASLKKSESCLHHRRRAKSFYVNNVIDCIGNKIGKQSM